VHEPHSTRREEPVVADPWQPVAQGLRLLPANPIPVVRVNSLVRRSALGSGLVSLHPEHPLVLLGPGHDVLREIPVPASDVGDILGLAELELAALEALFDRSALRDVHQHREHALVPSVLEDGVRLEHHPGLGAVLALETELPALRPPLPAALHANALGDPADAVHQVEDRHADQLAIFVAEHLAQPRRFTKVYR